MGIELTDFIGIWRLEREIDDLRLGLKGRLDGRCVFASDGAELVQTETGVLRFGHAAPMQAQRVYRWRAEGARLVVRFDDGRAFHDFGPDCEAGAEHLCGQDMYRVRYRFVEWPVWTSTWRVTGPRKDLILRSRFSREPPDQ